MIVKFNSLLKKSRDQKGFTLVELIVVMAILAILAALAVPRFASIMQDSKYNAHNQNVIMIYKAGQMYLSSGATANITSLAGLASAGYLTDANLKRPYDTSQTYTVTVTVSTGAVSVSPGLATKGDKGWSVADSYTGS